MDSYQLLETNCIYCSENAVQITAEANGPGVELPGYKGHGFYTSVSLWCLTHEQYYSYRNSCYETDFSDSYPFTLQEVKMSWTYCTLRVKGFNFTFYIYRSLCTQT